MTDAFPAFEWKAGVSPGATGSGSGLRSPGGVAFNAEGALQRLDWTGKVQFEVLTMHARPDGFELRFTAPVDAATAANPASYTTETFTHHYHEEYGSPEIEQDDRVIKSATVSTDGLGVRLVVDKLVRGHIHELHLSGVRDRAGLPLLHDVAYYTLNQIPKQ